MVPIFVDISLYHSFVDYMSVAFSDCEHLEKFRFQSFPYVFSLSYHDGERILKININLNAYLEREVTLVEKKKVYSKRIPKGVGKVMGKPLLVEELLFANDWRGAT